MAIHVNLVDSSQAVFTVFWAEHNPHLISRRLVVYRPHRLDADSWPVESFGAVKAIDAAKVAKASKELKKSEDATTSRQEARLAIQVLVILDSYPCQDYRKPGRDDNVCRMQALPGRRRCPWEEYSTQ
ncbi:hypothetical protein NDU88_005103 [Pleurodeles waltl]|uniref:Uncharacterized protein n=1 Tax=Pleurodeles waltl TaxID=8319 RepID=A0AAV7QHD0_PLEWA|nr:hypothetical protein NDU88_005103 [Pleurodeles waltl]